MHWPHWKWSSLGPIIRTQADCFCALIASLQKAAWRLSLSLFHIPCQGLWGLQGWKIGHFGGFYFKLLLNTPLRISVQFMLGDSGAARVTSLFCGMIVPSLNALKIGGIACVKISKRGGKLLFARKEETSLAVLDRLNGETRSFAPVFNAERRLDEAPSNIENKRRKKKLLYTNIIQFVWWIFQGNR